MDIFRNWVWGGRGRGVKACSRGSSYAWGRGRKRQDTTPLHLCPYWWMRLSTRACGFGHCALSSLCKHNAVALDRHQVFVKNFGIQRSWIWIAVKTDTENMVRKADFRIPSWYLLWTSGTRKFSSWLAGTKTSNAVFSVFLLPSSSHLTSVFQLPRCLFGNHN